MTHTAHELDRVAAALDYFLPPGVDRRAAASDVLEALHAPPTGAELIAAERTRQVIGEGWTPDHDREHPPGILALAGACYLLHATVDLDPTVSPTGLDQFAVGLWPFEQSWYKPRDAMRDLVRGGALAAAEIDRAQQ